MKSVYLLPLLLLAACAPAVQVDPTYTASGTYSGTCAAALAQLDASAIRTRPAVLFGANSWTPLTPTSKSANSAAYVSTNGTAVVSYGVVRPVGGTVTVIASCAESEGRATITLATSGQQKRFVDTLNTSLLNGIRLP